MIDIEEELKILENSVRDIIELVMFRNYGSNWIENLIISTDRIEKWKERKITEEKRLKGIILETRLIYYSDFYDLRSIINKHWENGLREIFQDKESIIFYLREIEKYRDPNAHRRELFEYQKHLIKGISGEIRTRIMKYRGKKEEPNDFFPVIEAFSDNLGNGFRNPQYSQMILSNQILRVGDSVEIIGYSTDPLGDQLEFSIARIGENNWNPSNKAIITFRDSDIGKCCDIQIKIKSKREYHAYGNIDDSVSIRYVIVPK